MNADRLLALYDRVADAPDAIARLRRFVLDLAVRGKLVEQNSADEPASELLKRITAEKARLVAAGKFKTLGGSRFDDVDFSFPIPANWTWCYLDDLAAIARGGSPRPIKSYLTDDRNGIPWIKIGDSARGSTYINNTKERIRPEGLAKSRLVFPGDLLLSNSMSFGYPYITNIEGCIHDGWLVIRTPEALLEKLYLHTVFLSGHAKGAFSEAASGAVVQNLNADKVRLLSVPLPPLAEQHRIVAKVDELMALCDRLEEARTAREDTRDRLTKASLSRLSAPDTDDVTFRSHACIALDVLPALSARADQVKHLRQTILNLAVRGKLVEQDPADEPASELLKRIASEKARLVKAGVIKKPSSFVPVVSVDQPFLVPVSWKWISSTYPAYGVSDLGKKIKTKDVLEGGAFPVVDQGKVLVRGYCNDARKVIKVSKPVVVFGDHTRETKLIDFDFVVGADGVKILQPVCIDASFYHLALRWLPLDSRGYGRHFKLLKSSCIPLPPLAEQQRIVAKVDELLALCSELEDSLATADTSRSKLLDSLLHEALVSDGNEIDGRDNA